MKTKLLTAFLFLIVTSTQVLAARPSINTLNTRVNQLEAENNAQQVEIDDLDVRVTALEASPPPFGVVGTVDVQGMYALDLLEMSFSVTLVSAGGGVTNLRLDELSVLVDTNGGAELPGLFNDFSSGAVFPPITIASSVLGLTLVLEGAIVEAFDYNPDNSIDYPRATLTRIAFSPEAIFVTAPNGNQASWDLKSGENNGCSVPVLYSNATQQNPGSFERASISGFVNPAGQTGPGAEDPILFSDVKLEGVQTVNEAPCYFGAVVDGIDQGDGTVNLFDPAGLTVQSITLSGMLFTSYQLSLTVEGLKQDVTIAPQKIGFSTPPPPK